MTVYVDDMRRPARIGHCRPALWSHLIADTHDELVEFGARLKLRPEWLQDRGGVREHYDVTAATRARAIREGAIPISYPRETAAVLARKRTAEADRARRYREIERWAAMDLESTP